MVSAKVVRLVSSQRAQIEEYNLVTIQLAVDGMTCSHCVASVTEELSELAGVGSVESSHASIGDAGLDAEGVAQPHITGPVLDGSEGVRAVEDTDEGELDGDDEWDRAVGPMQFLPETWQRYAVDGNQNG